MRLPLSKVYRAFPELRGYSDEECRRLLSRVTRTQKSSNLLVSSFGFMMAVVAIVFGMMLVAMIVVPIMIALNAAVGAMLLTTLLLSVFLLTPLIVWARHEWLLGELRDHLASGKCVCSYSLLGLAAADGRVTCPECGTSTILLDDAVRSR